MILIHLLIAILPWPLKWAVLTRIFGHKIDYSARIGISLVRAEHITMGPKARIGHLNRISGLRTLVMHEHSEIVHMNWVSGMPKSFTQWFQKEVDRDPSLILERHCAITNRHIIDCTDRIHIGAFTTVAGWGSQFLTHAIDITESRQSCAPTTIGAYCFVGTAVIVLKGSRLPDYSVLGAGSLLGKAFSDEYMLYSGVPAIPAKELSKDAGYFHRPVGYVN